MQTLQPPSHLANWHDPIVAEIHSIRQQLNEKYHGDLHAYSQAATASAVALGFKFYKPPTNKTTPTASEA
jgi:hypothetical protein